MSDLKKKLLKIAGKDDFELDPAISSGYIVRLCRKYGWMKVRGMFLVKGKSGIAKDVFIGRGVKLIEKDKITIGEKTKIHDHVKIDALSREGVQIGHHAVIGNTFGFHIKPVVIPAGIDPRFEGHKSRIHGERVVHQYFIGAFYPETG